MTTESKYQLACLDESYLSDVSDENQSEVLGGTFGLLSWLFGGWKGSYSTSQPTTQPLTIVNNNYNTIYVNGGSSGASAGASAGASSGGSAPKPGH